MPQLIWQENNYRIVQQDADPDNPICYCSHKKEHHLNGSAACSHPYNDESRKLCSCRTFRPIKLAYVVEQLFHDAMAEASWRAVSRIDEGSKGMRLPGRVFRVLIEAFQRANSQQTS